LGKGAIVFDSQSTVDREWSLKTGADLASISSNYFRCIQGNTMTFYQQLLDATTQERNALMSQPLITKGGAGDLTLATYLAFLTQAYHHVKHTTPLLMACGGRLSGEYEWLRTAIGEYIEEEMGHQEWVLNDIEACGGDKEAVRLCQSPNTSPSLRQS
jgi:hypothetical protein